MIRKGEEISRERNANLVRSRKKSTEKKKRTHGRMKNKKEGSNGRWLREGLAVR